VITGEWEKGDVMAIEVWDQFGAADELGMCTRVVCSNAGQMHLQNEKRQTDQEAATRAVAEP